MTLCERTFYASRAFGSFALEEFALVLSNMDCGGEASFLALLLTLSKQQIEYLINKNCGNSLGNPELDMRLALFP